MTLIPRQQAADRLVAPFRAAGGAPPQKPREGRPTPDETAAETEPLANAGHMARRIAELEETLLLEREAQGTACDAARAEGREEGLKQAAARDGERFDLLREALDRASAEFAAKIERHSDLAVTIARTALQRIFGTYWQPAEMVEAVVRHDALQLAAGSVIRVRVSADDFPDDAALSTLAAVRGIEIERDVQLESGACLFDCTLGTVDASIPVQAGAADELLSRFAPGAGDTA